MHTYIQKVTQWFRSFKKFMAQWGKEICTTLFFYFLSDGFFNFTKFNPGRNKIVHITKKVLLRLSYTFQIINFVWTGLSTFFICFIPWLTFLWNLFIKTKKVPATCMLLYQSGHPHKKKDIKTNKKVEMIDEKVLKKGS